MDVRTNGEFRHATEQAILCDFDGYEHWVPKSQIVEISTGFDFLNPGDHVEIWLPEWLAQDKQIPYE